ncbi:hypothetical protein A1O3_00316 [Capronia epimyces CBS 606.96]|uniref:Fe2OG dioxygenase domain-containing protein n=1 Tax=Capronia epimyces CBS 606.96 TaxID=1182542 RepID=W9YR66_9EURO|nr:uncharacterized protein A1O3_00316 [Capronia epimyces CBS 606.96]EXJ91766.1 hypothetical protein A1O3_00316 [Capronia epimyces CBS 606.96]
MALSACRCPRAMRTSSYPRARQSPFGKGAETVVDTSVRKSWQLDPTQFSLRNPKWKAMMDQILQKVDTGLHLHCGAESVSAELYKLLLYEEGAFFKPHKDSEKSPGMFGTLVVCLPSSHQGGELVLSHNHEKVELKTAPTSDFDMSYAAWYSDVLHEVKPVTQGYRLVLVYNLVKRNPTTMLMPLSLTSHQDRLVAVLRQWFVEPNAPQWPEYLVHRFEHQYTQASLRPDLLKGADLEQTRYLKAAAAELGFSLYLATLERTVIEDEEAEEEIDRTAALKHVVTMDGVRVDDPKSDKGMVIPEDHLLADDDVRLDEADDEDHSGYTGNEGVTATCFYRDTVCFMFLALLTCAMFLTTSCRP